VNKKSFLVKSPERLQRYHKSLLGINIPNYQ
jgi:hypothetical protein